MRRLLKRPAIVAALVLVVVIGSAYALLPVGGEGRISRAWCDKIQTGWSIHNVRELMGEQELWSAVDTCYFAVWVDEDENVICVEFSGLGTFVTRKEYISSELSFLERTRRQIARRIMGRHPHKAAVPVSFIR